MEDQRLFLLFQKIYTLIAIAIVSSILLLTGTLYYLIDPSLSLISSPTENVEIAQKDGEQVLNGIHLRTGLKEGEGLMLVVQNCTNCHSAKMITQNRATKEGWSSMIKWMQQTQGLWNLGTNEEKIIDYLATQYPPQKKGRRQRLTNIDWYELK